MEKYTLEIIQNKSLTISRKIKENIDVEKKTFNAKELRSALNNLCELRNYMIDNGLNDKEYKELRNTINNEAFYVSKILNSSYKKKI